MPGAIALLLLASLAFGLWQIQRPAAPTPAIPVGAESPTQNGDRNRELTEQRIASNPGPIASSAPPPPTPAPANPLPPARADETTPPPTATKPANIPPPARESASDDAALKTALLSHTWTWKPLGSGSFSWNEIIFGKDGTMTTSTNTSARWTITGPRLVTLQFSTGDRIDLTFHSEFDYYTGCRANGEQMVNGWIKSAQQSVPTANPTSSSNAASTSVAAGQELVPGTWRWDDTKAEFTLFPNGIATAAVGGAGRWFCTNPDTKPPNYKVNWGTYLDTLNLVNGGMQLVGQNQTGQKLRASRVVTSTSLPVALRPIYSTGFEAPFHPGKLEGQDSHWAIFANGFGSDTANSVRIAGNVGRYGNQAVQISALPAKNIQTGASCTLENSAKVVHFQADFFLNRSLHQTPWQFWPATKAPEAALSEALTSPGTTPMGSSSPPVFRQPHPSSRGENGITWKSFSTSRSRPSPSCSTGWSPPAT